MLKKIVWDLRTALLEPTTFTLCTDQSERLERFPLWENENEFSMNFFSHHECSFEAKMNTHSTRLVISCLSRGKSCCNVVKLIFEFSFPYCLHAHLETFLEKKKKKNIENFSFKIILVSGIFIRCCGIFKFRYVKRKNLCRGVVLVGR